MRIVFLDEAGVSHPEQEPFAVMAGVIVHADYQWRALEEELWRLLEKEFGSPPPPGAYFHAHALYKGRTPFDEKNGWDEDRRLATLQALVDILTKFNLPVLHGYTERAEWAQRPYAPKYADPTTGAVVWAGVSCILRLERWMRAVKDIEQDEVAKIIIEDSPQFRNCLNDIYRECRHPTPEQLASRPNASLLPIRHVMARPTYEEKRDASLLQLADVCAYVIKRKLMGDPKIDPFYQPLNALMAMRESDPSNPLFSRAPEAYLAKAKARSS